MHLTCPCCGAAYTIEVLLADRDAREAVSTAFRLPPSLSERLLRYIALFRPAKRALSWGRAARLMAELEAMITAAKIEYDGQSYPAPVDAWRIAIDQMLDSRDRLVLPLGGHGYLIKVLVGLHQRANDQRAARQEVAEEHARAREGARTGGMQGATALAHAVAAQAGVASAQAEKPIPEPRAPRVPPPSMFRDLAGRLRGVSEEVAHGQDD